MASVVILSSFPNRSCLPFCGISGSIPATASANAVTPERRGCQQESEMMTATNDDGDKKDEGEEREFFAFLFSNVSFVSLVPFVFIKSSNSFFNLSALCTGSRGQPTAYPFSMLLSSSPAFAVSTVPLGRSFGCSSVKTAP